MRAFVTKIAVSNGYCRAGWLHLDVAKITIIMRRKE